MRDLLGRLLLAVGLILCGATALVGGLALPAAGLVATGLVSAAVGCLVAGRERELPRARRRHSVAEAALLGAAVTAGSVLVTAGLVVMAGAPAAVVVALVVFAAGVGLWVRRTSGLAGSRRGRSAERTRRTAQAGGAAQPMPPLRPVQELSNEGLGREWLLSSSALTVLLDVRTRQSIVRRRQDLLDELERRDPVGFARWLAAGPVPGSDPADYLHGDAAADQDAA